MKKVMTATEIMEMIPNRYPICYIDYVDEIIPNEKIIATKNVTINEEFFQGHFPGNPTRDFVGIGKATAYVEDKKVCECELTFIVGR